MKPQQEQLQERRGRRFLSKRKAYGRRDARQWLNDIKETTGVKGKALFQPLRIALTASEHGPDMSVLNQLLGEDTNQTAFSAGSRCRMSELQLYNSLSQQKEVFQTDNGPVKINMYVCGMTVYDFCHLGHARMIVAFDMISRVTYVRVVMN